MGLGYFLVECKMCVQGIDMRNGKTCNHCRGGGYYHWTLEELKENIRAHEARIADNSPFSGFHMARAEHFKTYLPDEKNN